MGQGFPLAAALKKVAFSGPQRPILPPSETQAFLPFLSASLAMCPVESLLWLPSAFPIKSRLHLTATKLCEAWPCPSPLLPTFSRCALPLCLGCSPSGIRLIPDASP